MSIPFLIMMTSNTSGSLERISEATEAIYSSLLMPEPELSAAEVDYIFSKLLKIDFAELAK